MAISRKGKGKKTKAKAKAKAKNPLTVTFLKGQAFLSARIIFTENTARVTPN